MAEVLFNVNMDLVDKYVPAEDITIPQEDNLSVKFTYSIFNREIAEDLTGATDTVVSFVKPDGHIVLQSNGTLVLPNKVNIVANAQAFTYVGKVYMQVQYKKGTQTYNTRQAFFWVERSNTSCQTVASADFAPYLDNVVATGEMLNGLDLQALIDSKQTAEGAQADVNGIKPRVVALEVAVSDLQSRMTTMETDVTVIKGVNTTQDTRLTTLEAAKTANDTKNTTQDNRLTALETGQTTQDNRLTAIETKNTTQDTRLTTLETATSGLPTMQSDITAIKGVNTTQDSRLGALETAKTANDTKNATQDTNIANNASAIGTLQTSQATQDTKIANLEASQGTDNTRMTAIETKNTQQDGRLTAIEAVNTTQDTDIADIKTKNTTQDTRLTDLESGASSLATTVANNKTAQDTVNTSTAGSISTLNTKMTAVETKNSQQDTRLDTAEAKNATQDTKIAAIEAINANAVADINALEILTGEHEGRLDTNDTKNATQDSLISANTLEISSLTTTVNNNQAGMNTRVTNLETAKTANDTKNTQQDNRLTALENYDVTQDTKITALETAKTANDIKNTQQDGRLTAIENYNTTQDTRMTVIEGVNTTQNNRLTTNEADISGIKSNVEKMFLNPLRFKQVGDTDDSAGFNRMIQYAKDNNLRSIVIPFGTYTLTSRVVFDKVSDLEIDLQNSTIIWNGSSVITNDRNIRYYGAFTFTGESVGSAISVSNWVQELDLTQNIIPEVGFAGNTVNCSKITVSSSSGFQNGDYVRFRVGDALASGNADYTNVFKPTVDILCKILHVVGNDIYLDYHNPYDFSQVNIATQANITKVNPVKNITIKNVYINDISPYAAPAGNIGDNPNRNKLVSGIGMNYAVNCKIENVRGRGLKLPLVMVKSSYAVETKNINNEYPESHGGGEGYCIHYEFCMKCHAFDVQGNGGNSVLDFSSSAFCSGTRVKTTNSYSYKTMGTHSEAEHDITFRDCEGVFGFSNSTEWFAGMSINIVLDNCRGKIVSQMDSYTDILVKGGTFTFPTNSKNYFKGLTFQNATVKFGYQVDMSGHLRGINRPSKIEFIDTDVICVDNLTGVYTRVKFLNLDAVNFIEGCVDFTGFEGRMSIEDVKDIKSSSNFKNVPIVMFNRNNKINRFNVNINSKSITFDSNYPYGTFMELDNIKQVSGIINVTGAVVSNLKDANISYFTFNNDTNKQDTNLFINLVGNTFYSQFANRLSVYNGDESVPAKNYIKKQNAVGNTAVNTSLLGTWDMTSNYDTTKSRTPAVPFMELNTNASGSVQAQQKGILSLNNQTNRLFLSYGTSNAFQWLEMATTQSGSTANRPSVARDGTMYFDDTLGKPVFRSGSNWKLADGTTV